MCSSDLMKFRFLAILPATNPFRMCRATQVDQSRRRAKSSFTRSSSSTKPHADGLRSEIQTSGATSTCAVRSRLFAGKYLQARLTIRSAIAAHDAWRARMFTIVSTGVCTPKRRSTIHPRDAAPANTPPKPAWIPQSVPRWAARAHGQCQCRWCANRRTKEISPETLPLAAGDFQLMKNSQYVLVEDRKNVHNRLTLYLRQLFLDGLFRERVRGIDGSTRSTN